MMMIIIFFCLGDDYNEDKSSFTLNFRTGKLW